MSNQFEGHPSVPQTANCTTMTPRGPCGAPIYVDLDMGQTLSQSVSATMSRKVGVRVPYKACRKCGRRAYKDRHGAAWPVLGFFRGQVWFNKLPA